MTPNDTSTTAQLKQHIAEVLRDLQQDGVRDGEAMSLIGSLAADLAAKLNQSTWTGAKTALSSALYDELLESFMRRGNEMQRQGKTRHAYAIQALAVSLVARTQTDPEVVEGAALLDGLIDRALAITLMARKASLN